MKNLKSKKAITLIALVITVIVMMILAGATVYLAFNGGGLIGKVKQTSIIQELKEVEEQVMLRIEEERLNKFANNEKFNISDYTSLENFSPKIESKYSEYIVIKDGKVYLKINTPEDIKKAGENIGISTTINLKIYGNSIQNGTPSPENPSEIQSVGDLTSNIFDTNKLVNNNYVSIIDTGIQVTNYYACLVMKMSDLLFKPNTTYYIHCEKEYSEKQTDATGRIANLLNLGILLNYNQTNATFTTGDNVSGNLFFYGFAEGDVKFKNLYIGTEPYTEYEPYGKYKIPMEIVNDNGENEVKNIYLNEPLRKVGDMADYIDFESGKVVRNIGEFTIDSNTKLSKFNGVTDYAAFYINVPDIQNVEVISDKFEYHKCALANANTCWSGAYQVGGSIATTYDRICFTLPNTITSVDEAKEWLKDNPIKVYYQLKTPIEERIDIPNLKGIDNLNIKTKIQPSKCIMGTGPLIQK